MKKKESAPFGAGVSSLLMVFVVLCLTVFGVLAYMTARADSRLTQRSAQMVQAYYAADAEAEEALARLDAALLEMPEKEALESAGFTVGANEQPLTGKLEIPVDGTRIYRMQVEISGGDYRITVRQTEDNTVWEDEILDVWDGR